MSTLHPAAYWVLVGVAAIGVAGLVWTVIGCVYLLRQWWRARNADVDFLLWDGELEDER